MLNEKLFNKFYDENIKKSILLGKILIFLDESQKLQKPNISCFKYLV